MIHEARLVPIGGRPHTSSSVNSYMGDSRGWWDGNTLVVETTNSHETAPYIVAFMAGVCPVPGKDLRVIERFTRIAPGRVEWTVTLDDPTTWERPWTYSLPMTQDNSQPIFEYACHEGNYGIANLLSAGRAAEPGARDRVRDRTARLVARVGPPLTFSAAVHSRAESRGGCGIPGSPDRPPNRR